MEKMIREISNELTFKRTFQDTRREIRKGCSQTSLRLLLLWGHLGKESLRSQQQSLLYLFSLLRQSGRLVANPADKTQPLAIGMTFIAKSYCTVFMQLFSQ